MQSVLSHRGKPHSCTDGCQPQTPQLDAAPLASWVQPRTHHPGGRRCTASSPSGHLPSVQSAHQLFLNCALSDRSVRPPSSEFRTQRRAPEYQRPILQNPDLTPAVSHPSRRLRRPRNRCRKGRVATCQEVVWAEGERKHKNGPRPVSGSPGLSFALTVRARHSGPGGKRTRTRGPALPAHAASGRSRAPGSPGPRGSSVPSN